MFEINSAQSVAACALVIEAADISSVTALLCSNDDELLSINLTTFETLERTLLA